MTMTTPFTRQQPRRIPTLLSVLFTILASVPSSTCTPCSLECSHGTTCQRLDGDVSSLMTSGRMVESCGTCPPKWAGVSCDIPIIKQFCACYGQECLESNNNNNNNNNNECGDRCAVADQVSVFAGTMCRAPTTEYCSSSLPDQYDDSFHYCTHGGTCAYDTTNSSSSSSCKCTPEFKGPHCEALVLPEGLVLEEKWFHKQQNTFTATATAALSSVLVGFAIGFIIIRRRQATTSSRERFFRESNNMWKPEEEMVTFEKPRTTTHSFMVV